MKPHDTGLRKSTRHSWLASFLLQQLDGAYAFEMPLDGLESFRRRHSKAATITTGVIAGIEISGKRVRINCIETDAKDHDLVPDQGDGYRVTSFFAFGRQGETVDQRKVMQIIGVNRRDVIIDQLVARTIGNFLYDGAGVGLSTDVQIDARFVGDTASSVIVMNDGHMLTSNKLVILAYSVEQHLVLARDLSGKLYVTPAAKLFAKPETMLGSSDAWTEVGGVGPATKIFRIGRLIMRGNELVAPISTSDGLSDEPRHGVMKLDVSRMRAAVIVDIHGTTEDFIMTALGEKGSKFMAYTAGKLRQTPVEQLPEIYKPYATAAQATA